MSVSDRVVALRNQLDEDVYELDAGEFIRYRSEANDDAVAGVVRSVVAEGEEGCDVFRQGLGTDEVDTLRLFAMRRTLLARRSSSLGPIYEAMDAFALLPGTKDVPWDSWVKGAFFVSRSIGGDLSGMDRRFADLNPDDSDRFHVAVESMARVSEFSQCHLVEVTTDHGVGFVETLMFLGKPTFAVFGAPRQADNFVAFQPTTNLAQLCASLADAFDSSGEVTTGPIGQDQLAATSFSRTASGSYLPTLGCLSFVARDVAGSSLTVFVAELTSDEDPTALAAAATETDDQVAVADASRVILLSPQPSFDEELDVPIDAHEFEDFARAALLEPSAR
ncbi:MAG: hypothetical protein ACRDVC_11645 [Acidimicrobiales bacterium]